MIEYLPHMCEALGSNPNTEKRKQNQCTRVCVCVCYTEVKMILLADFTNMENEIPLIPKLEEWFYAKLGEVSKLESSWLTEDGNFREKRAGGK